VTKQAALGSHFHGPHERAVELAEMLVNAIPCGEMVRFAGTGAEATFFALRLVRAFTGKQKILKFEGAYHGNHDYVLNNVAPPFGSNEQLASRLDSAGIPDVIKDIVIVAPYNDIETTRNLIEHHAKDLAAVIVEPVQRAIGPEAGFLEGLREITRKNDVLLVFDEVVTGFRLAYGGAQEYFGVIPDLAAYGKAIGTGYPIAAVAGPKEIMMLADPARRGKGDYVYVTGTLSGNPLCCAAAIAGLKELSRPGVFDRLNAAGEAFSDAFSDLLAEFDVPNQVATVGSMFRVFFTEEKTTPRNYQGQAKTDQAKFVRFCEALFQQNIFMSPRPKSFVSTVHSDADLALLRAAIRTVCESGFFEQ
jgi:glutamate-1-semialdehyde 2,1-aminomutase